MRILLLLGMLAAGAWFGPQLMQGAASPCPALELQVASLVQKETGRLPPGLAADPRVAAIIGGIAGFSRGALAENYVRERFPALPQDAACVAAWWKLKIDPDISPTLSAR